MEIRNILVTGATGYIGGRLIPKLLEKGYRVRVLVRDPERLIGRPWVNQVETFQGDVLKPESLPQALMDIDVAYYLIHSMSDSEEFDERDKRAAENFGSIAKKAGIKRIIYLGGLGESEADLSKHLRSRHQTGEVLRKSGVPVTEFRAAIIVGSGSVSFEMIRYLTERIPVMICPTWVFTRVQPIAIHDVLKYLVDALVTPDSADKIIEIGGKDVITYGEMMMVYAHTRDLKRILIPVPVLTPRLSSYWVHWVTPISASIAKPLIDGLKNEVIVNNDIAKQLFPGIEPLDYHTALRRSLAKLEAGKIETSWSDALTTSQGDIPPVVLKTHDGMIIERRELDVDAPPESTFQAITGLGGDRGWLYFNWAWKIRGIIDRIFGGVGFRRGRRDPKFLRVGDAVDFMRVEAIKINRLLRLRAEMKVPGKAWLQFEIEPLGVHRSRLILEAYFAPKGLAGLMYWYVIYPIHIIMFGGILKQLANEAIKLPSTDEPPILIAAEENLMPIQINYQDEEEIYRRQ